MKNTALKDEVVVKHQLHSISYNPWQRWMNFIRLLRVVITPSVTAVVAKRKKLLKAIGWNSGYDKGEVFSTGCDNVTNVHVNVIRDFIFNFTGIITKNEWEVMRNAF